MDAFDPRFVTAYSKTTGKPRRVPKHYLDHPVLGANLTTDPIVVDDAPYPAGDPTDDWKGQQLEAYADAHQVDLTGSKGSKAQMVAAINTEFAARAAAGVTTSSTDGTASSGETPA